MTPACDVVVVGAGVVGCSVAWHIAAAGGGRVVVLDRIGVGAGMTSLQPGGLRTQWSSATTRALALESRAFYHEAADRLGVPVDLGFQACGYLFIADTDGTAEELARDAEAQRGDGVAVDAVDAEAVAELVPSVDPARVAGGTFGSTDGYLDHPGAPVAAFAAAAEQAGVVFERADVTGVRVDGDGVRVDTVGGSVSAGRVVLAAGADVPDVLADDVPTPPVSWSPKTLFYSDPVRGRLFEPLAVFVDRALAVKHLSDGTVLASDLQLGAVTTTDEGPEKQRIRRLMSDAVPLLEHVRYPVRVEGQYDVTPDKQALVGPLESAERIWTACGMNGRGMMTAPAVGRLVADGLTSGAAALPLDLLPQRFDGVTEMPSEARII